MAVSLFLPAGVLSAWSMVAADAFVRTDWPYFRLRDHVLGALGMYAAVGALLGLIAAALVRVELAVVGRRVRRPWLYWTLRPLFYGVVGGLASISTAIWTFSGEHVQRTTLSVWGPVAFVIFAGAAAASGAAVLLFALRSLQGRGRAWIGIALALFAAGALIAHVDLTVYVALYSRVHTILELVAALCFGAAYALVLAFVSAFPRPRRALVWVGGGFAVWLAATLLLRPLRTWFDESLKHVWLEEVYVGRMLRRTQVAEAFLSDPFHWRGMHMARIATLQARYGLRDLRLSKAWSQPLQEPPSQWDALRQLRRGQSHYNVIVYYVDTLRADVARDKATMPELDAFRQRAVDFTRAYAVGSDTLRSLPALTGGNYDVLDTPDNDVLRVAKRADYDTGLAIAKSAYEFLGKLRPNFYFDRTLVVEDYPAEQQVWGYGAQQPTAPRLVDQALQFIDTPRKQPFFLWLFNFDQHNWRELDSEYIDQNAKRHSVPEGDVPFPFRYRVVARAIDHEFGRLLDGLEQRHLLDKTIILFVSDHGEALGRDGFWVHSVFLWECLIRVPLVLYAPGLPAQRVDNKVSLVDVAPTLGRYLDPTLDGHGFQGEDLLSQLLPRRAPRRFPLLLIGASKDLLVRIGLVDPTADRKLVLSFEAALPELYDLRAQDPDAFNLAAREPERVRRGLDTLVRSPIFPRSADDFELRDTRAQRALTPASDDP